MSRTDHLERIATATDWLPAGWTIVYRASVASTQDEARAAAATGAGGRIVFVADHQTYGRGRQGRPWSAPPGTALLVSVLFRDLSTTPTPWQYTSLAALALVDAIQAVAPLQQPAVKWPNDVMLADRKVAGVLAESTWNGQQLAIVVGIGLNVSMRASQLAQVSPKATSLREVLGHDVDRGVLLQALVSGLHAWLDRPAAERGAAWQSRLWGRGQRVRLRGLESGHRDDHEVEVIVLGTDPDGALRVRLADGSEVRTVTAEILL